MYCGSKSRAGQWARRMGSCVMQIYMVELACTSQVQVLEEVRYLDIWGKAFQTESRAPEVKYASCVARNSKEVKVVRAEKRGRTASELRGVTGQPILLGIAHLLSEGVRL